MRQLEAIDMFYLNLIYVDELVPSGRIVIAVNTL
jgi:hypothetical protein